MPQDTPFDPGNLPGTQREREIEQQEAQRGFFGNIAAGFEETALSDAMVAFEQEGTPLIEERDANVWNPVDRLRTYGALLLGERAGGEQDYSDRYEELTTGIPSQFHEEILDEPNAAAAERARMRILDQLNRAQISAQQQGLSQNLAMIAGGFLDVDAPLMTVTGGGYKAAAVARHAVRASRAVGLSPQGALRTSSAAVGLNAGLQAGIAVGSAQAAIRETADWTLVAESALMSTILGGAANPLLRGDVNLAGRAAQEELYKRMARDDPSLHDSPNVDPTAAERLHAEDFQGPVVFEDGVESTVGAQQVQPAPGVVQTPMDANMSDAVKDIGTMADNWRHDSDWQDWKIAEQDEWWAQVALSGLFNVTTDNWRQMYKSNSSVMNWMLGNVFESPNGMGRGRYTAATGMESYHRRIAQQFTQPVSEAFRDYGRRHNVGALPGTSAYNTALQRFNREVMLEMNDRALGRTPPTRDPAVVRAADAYDRAGAESVRIAKGDNGQLSVDGFDAIPERSGYSPYVWNGRRMRQLERDGVVRRSDVVNAMAVAYRTAGLQATKDAHIVAKAVVDRAMAESDEINTNLIALLSGDGREWLNKALENNGMPQADREALLKRLTGEVEERGKESFAKKRNDIDLNHQIQTADGSELRVVDLMDQDMHGVWQRYTRRMSGAAALARVGITNRAQREQFIQAAQAQQRALGEDPVDGDQLRAMLSHFDGGPVHGFSKFGRRYEKGVAPEAALVKRMTNLALLGKLGFAQLAETGAAIAASGLENWMRRGPMALLNDELKKGNKELLDDLAFITGDLGRDHHLFSEHLDLDDMNASDRGEFMTKAHRLSQQATYYQGFVSGFNHVRGFQQRVAAGAITDKIFRTVREVAEGRTSYDQKFLDRMRADLGIFPEDLAELERLVNAGTIEFAPEGFVNRINADQWDTDVAERFGSTIVRNMNQVVQKSLAGEQDTWMHTTVGSIITHLKTFPLQAMQKQFVRNVRHLDAQTRNTVLMGAATAALAIMVRDKIDGRDRDLADTAKTAFGYSNLTGWVPMIWDPAMTMLGMEDMRINQYGPHNDYTPATVTWANRAARLPGAAIDTLTGDADYWDSQSLKALPFANVAGLGRIF